MKRYLIAALAAMVLAAGSAAGETVSDLLQKAIYAEETAGDLDGAIKLYRQVLATSGETRALAAQAQYRLGMCLVRKGDQAGAKQAFEALIKEYPDQKELVAKAREAMPENIKFLPAPWREGEILEMRMRLAAGAVLGTQMYTVDHGPGDSLILQTKSYMGGSQWISRVEADRDTMRPRTGVLVNPILGDFRISYLSKQARIESADKPAHTIDLEGVVYDNEEAPQLMRLLPLALGGKYPLTLISPAGGVPVTVTFEVLGSEDVTVPAGKFRAFKLECKPVRQFFWVAQDAPRYLVKFEAGAVTSELVAARRSDSTEPLNYTDEKFGVSFSAPPVWSVQPAGMAGKPEESLSLLDPQAQGHVAVWEGKYPIAKEDIEARLRKDAEEKVPGRQQAMTDYRVRQDSWQTRNIGGRPALSFIADYKDKDKPMVEYLTWVRSENVSTQFMVRVAASDFEAFRRRVEPILESLRLR